MINVPLLCLLPLRATVFQAHRVYLASSFIHFSLSHTSLGFSLCPRYRWLPEGVEYDLLYKDEEGGSDSRVTLYQKLESPRVVRSMAVNQSKVGKQKSGTRVKGGGGTG